MVYKLLALDIDGTILRTNHRMDKRVKDAIEYVKQKGVYVTLATRRHFASAKKVAKALKLDTILITHNGAFMASDIDDPLSEIRISQQDVEGIVQFLEKSNSHVRIKHERFSLANRIKQNQEIIAKMTIGDPLFYPINFTDDLNEYVNESPVSPLQIEAFFNNEADRRAIYETLQLRFPNVDVRHYTDNRLEIVAKHVSKNNALNDLGEYLGINCDEMVAVGDSLADMDMIREAGLGVAMGNAHDAVKKHADWITRSNDQNGVAYMMKEVFRKQLRMQIHSL